MSEKEEKIKALKVWDKVFGREGKADLSWFSEKEIDCLEKLLDYYDKKLFTDLDKKNKTLKVYVTQDNFRDVLDIWLLLAGARKGAIALAVKHVDLALKEQGIEDDAKE